MAAGSIVVDLLMRTGSFESDTDRAQKKLQAFGKAIDKEIAGAIKTAAAAAVGLVATAGAVVAAFQTLVSGAGKFQDLAEEVGDTAQNLASLASAAGGAGVTMESIGAAANRLTKGLVGVDDESKAVGSALKSLNIELEGFKRLSPVEQYEAVGNALGKFADGAGKTAVAMALFGKAGAEQLKVFKELEAQGGRQVILTQAQIEAADQMGDAQAKGAAQLKLYAQAAATQAIPALTDLTAVALDAVKEILGIDKASGQLAANNGVRAFAEGAVDALAFLVDQVDLVVRLFQVAGKSIAGYGAIVSSFAAGGFGAARAAGKAAEEDIQRVLDRATMAERLVKQRMSSALTGARSDAYSDPRSTLFDATRPARTDPRPQLAYAGPPKAPDRGAAKTANQLLKNELDGRLRAIKDFAEQQRDAFAFANQQVRAEYEVGNRSLAETFAVQQALRDSQLRATLANYDQQLVALRQFRDKTGKDTPERAEIENKIADAVRARAEAETKANRDATGSLAENAAAAGALRERYESLRASVHDLAGETRAAGEIRIGRQVAVAQTDAAQAGEGQGVVQEYEQRLRQQLELGEAQKQYALLLDRTRAAETAVYLAAAEGGKGELQTLFALGDARQRALRDLGELVKSANELAIASGGNPEAIRFAEQLGLAYRQAKAELDPLSQKIDATFAGAFEDAFADFLQGTASAKDAFASFADEVVRQLIRMAAQEAASALFKGGSGGDGGGGFWSTAASVVGSWFGGGRAGGGPVGPGKVYPVGERGAEVYDDGRGKYLITGAGRGRIDPNPRMSMGGGHSTVLNQTINVQGNVDRRTATQMGAEAQRAVSRAGARNN